MDEQQNEQMLAERAGRAMFERDAASRALGMQLVGINPGQARMTMPVRADMLNGHRCCHGGYIFMLADSAFAFACNARNQATLAAGASIDYLVPVEEGELLTAEASEQVLQGKTGFYDVRVTNRAGQLVALMRGRSHRIGGEVAP